VARNEISISAPPATVFDVLRDPGTYGEWVVGSYEIRDADEQFPAPGTAFYHSVGQPPLLIKDETVVVRAREPELIELRAKARPFPTARVILRLHPEGSGTRVTMIEDLSNRLLNLLGGPLTQVAIRIRNHESLSRLKRIAEAWPTPSS
jgi:uncharacterized protein YndB with AHSA1/START domain